MNILRRSQAPLTDEAWEAIDAEASAVLRANVATRRFVDVIGPRGWDCSAVNLGRLTEPATNAGVRWSLRRVQPLVEIRVPFELQRSELDDLTRGAREINLDPVRKAALEAAAFEERVIYEGLEGTGIAGIVASSEHEALAVPRELDALPERVADGMLALQRAGVEGPYLLMLGTQEYSAVAGETGAYPLRKRLSALVGEAPVHSPALEGALLVSKRGGDFRFTLGVDFSVGYAHEDGEVVKLYITESFTFQLTGPEAVVALQRPGAAAVPLRSAEG
jgi:uncharacterized linocin/CFP29 family protein